MTEDAKIEALRLINEIPESGPCNFYADPLMLDWAVKLIAAARAPQSGWVLVPVIPTRKMVAACGQVYDDLDAVQAWRDMLAAAPSPITGEKR